MQLQFSLSKLIDRFNFLGLPEIQQVQLMLAGRSAWGKDMTLQGIFEASEAADMVWQYYQIVDLDTTTTAYDAWILGDDAGTVFYTNSPQSTGVEMTQSFFDAVTLDEATEDLAEEIARAYRQANQAFDDESGFNSEKFVAYLQDFQRKLAEHHFDEAYWGAIHQNISSTLVHFS